MDKAIMTDRYADEWDWSGDSNLCVRRRDELTVPFGEFLFTYGTPDRGGVVFVVARRPDHEPG